MHKSIIFPGREYKYKDTGVDYEGESVCSSQGDETGAVADLWAGRSFTSCDCRSCKQKEQKRHRKRQPVSQTQEQTDDQIRQSYEKQLESVLSQVEGVGAVQVAVAMESTGKKQVEKDSPEDTSTSSEKVIPGRSGAVRR